MPKTTLCRNCNEPIVVTMGVWTHDRGNGYRTVTCKQAIQYAAPPEVYDARERLELLQIRDALCSFNGGRCDA